MKKLIVLVLSAVTIGLSSATVANSAPATASTSTSTNGSLATETINDIAIPTEVLIYVQTQYQGCAVTQAGKASRDGKEAYRLRVDPNDITTDYDGFYLFYDASWQLLGEEKITPPPTPKPTHRESSTRQSLREQQDSEDERREDKKEEKRRENPREWEH